MMDMMQNCWNWMMSFGILGMLVGVAILMLVIVLIIALIRRPSSR